MNNIYCIVGKSGSGKTTVANVLEKKFGFKQVCSYTTRLPRYKNEPGHFFVSKEDFDALGSLCAYTNFNNCEYGVPSSMVDECDIYVIDVAGVHYLQEHYTGGKGIKVIGLDSTEDELRRHMEARGDAKEKVNERIKHDREAFKGMKDVCDIIIQSKTINEIVNDIYGFILVNS